MKEVISEFNDKDNNNLLNTSESFMDNSLLNKNSIEEEDYSNIFKKGNYSGDISYTSTSSFSEEEIDKTNYIKYHNFKDFLIMLSLLMCSSFNFNYPYLLFLIIGFYYIKLILNNKMVHKRRKSTFEAFIFVYSFLLLIFKIVIIILTKNDNNVILDNKDTFLNLGVSYLNEKGIFGVIKTVIGESIINFSCICSFIIRRLFAFKDDDLQKNNYKEVKTFYKKLTKYIFFAFFFIVGFATFNKSILTLIYIILFYLFLFIFSLSSKKRVYLLFKGLFFITIFGLVIHILIINISNIYSISKYFKEKTNDNNNIILSNWAKIGFYYAFYNDDYITLFQDWAGYLLGCLSLVILSFTYKDITFDIFNVLKKKNKK